MEQNHPTDEQVDTLDDLIIKSKKSSGLKKILLAAAVLLLVLILIILVTKSLIQSDHKPQSSVIMPPEPAAQQQTPKEPLFEQVPIQEESSGAKKIDQVIEKIKNKPTKASEKPTEQPAVSAEAKTAAPVKTSPAKTAPTTPKTVAAKKSAPKPSAKKAKVAPKGGYFIQVGAFFRYPPDKKFLASIEKEGMHYVIVEGQKNGKRFKKVMVGPYPSKTEAKRDLDRVKKRINQNAYITYKK